jgi:hypothetical protein
MRKFLAAITVAIAATFGLSSTAPAFAGDTTHTLPASSFTVGVEESGLGCKSWQNHFTFYVSNNTSRAFKVYYYSNSPFEQGYYESRWFGPSAYSHIVESFESPTKYGQSMTVKVVVKQGDKSRTYWLYDKRPSRAACGL